LLEEATKRLMEKEIAELWHSAAATREAAE
jgi:hypothetical protein